MKIEVAQATCGVQPSERDFTEHCGRCACCNDDVNEAGNRRYDSSIHWAFAELSTGKFALYDHRGWTVLITDEWDAVLEHYRSRPPYIAPARPTRTLVATKSRGKLSAEEKRANTAALLAKLAGGNG